jgi:hypothetical protein
MHRLKKLVLFYSRVLLELMEIIMYQPQHQPQLKTEMLGLILTQVVFTFTMTGSGLSQLQTLLDQLGLLDQLVRIARLQGRLVHLDLQVRLVLQDLLVILEKLDQLVQLVQQVQLDQLVILDHKV